VTPVGPAPTINRVRCGRGVGRVQGPMQRLSPGSTQRLLGRAVLAGVAATGVMTAFQKLIEMPITGRDASYAPADFAETVLPVQPTTAEGRWRLNYATHFALGSMWGGAYGIAARKGLRGQKAINSVFGVVYTADVLLNTALGLYHPTRWTAQDWIVDVLDKYVQAQATGLIFDRVLDPQRSSR
jgi:hypothetical protein